MHLSTSILVYRDLISRLAKDFVFHINVNKFIKEWAIIIDVCIVDSTQHSGDNVLAKSLAGGGGQILWHRR